MRDLKRVEMGNPSLEKTLQTYVGCYEDLTVRIEEIDEELRKLGDSERHREDIGHMQKACGVGLVTALTVRTEMFRPEEFKSAREVSSYLGLTPSEYSSGDRRRLGHI